MNVKYIKSIGPNNEKILNKLDIYNIQDLFEYYPYKYKKIYNDIYLIDDIFVNNYIFCKILSPPIFRIIRNNLNILSFNVLIDSLKVKVIIFNRQFFKTKLLVNKKIIIYGKYDVNKNIFTASNIYFDFYSQNFFPIYHLTNKLSNSSISTFIFNALSINNFIVDNIPDYLNKKYSFLSKKEALFLVHFPSSDENLLNARSKLIYEELFVFLFKLSVMKILRNSNNKIIRYVNNDKIDLFFKNLSFVLTVDQVSACFDIKNDLLTCNNMNRIIIGDVGSGKTITAFYAIYLNYLSGYQSAFMVPTELLANQHFSLCIDFFKFCNIKISLLTSKTTKKNRGILLNQLLDGDVDLIIGTHSIINDDVIFKNLGLVIIDEEHRFGVLQRNILKNKGVKPDILYMSATPIPRSFAKILYKDIDVSLIKSKPPNRASVTTNIININNVDDVMLKMVDQIKNGNQIFVVCPLVEDSDSNNVYSVKSLYSIYSNYFENIANVGIIYGSMKTKEKDIIMKKFLIGEINILISTTVIEVGIDIQNATIIAIYNAERFGLATLHQLRGRVGRSNLESFCFLISDNNYNNRLQIIEESSDGFYITKRDFEERKEGDVFGIVQSGFSSFKVANFLNDSNLLHNINDDVSEFILKKLYLDISFYHNIYLLIENDTSNIDF